VGGGGGANYECRCFIAAVLAALFPAEQLTIYNGFIPEG